MAKIKVLITGGAGFVAASLAEKLLNDGNHYVVIVDNLITGDIAKVPNHPDCKFIKGDVNIYEDIAPVMTSFNFDYIFHYAALVGVQRTLNNPVMVLDDIKGIKNVLELSKSTNVKRVFFSSSSEVYGEPVSLPQHELTTPLNSRLPYAVVKNIGEAFCRSYEQEFGLDYTIFRFFNTYGPKQSTDFVMSKFIKSAIAGEDITVFGDGSQTRTFCYIDDNVDAVYNSYVNNQFINDVVNIGNDKITTIIELAQKIIKATNSTSKIKHLPELPEGDMTRRQPNIEKMKKLLNRDLTSMEDGMQKVLTSPTFNKLQGINE